MRCNLAQLLAMLLSVRYPSLQGSAQVISGRGRQCIVTAIDTHRDNLLGHSAAERLDLDLDSKLNRLVTANDLRSVAQVIRTDFPELHQPIKQLAQQRLDATVSVLYKQDTSKKQMVPRSLLLRASSTCATVEEFLKKQLQVPAHQKVKITFSSSGSPSEAEEYELTDKILEQYPMAFIVGYANAWFVSEL